MIDQSVADVMMESVRTVTAETTASDVARLFADHDIGSAVVVDPGSGELLGIVTESDVMHQVAIDADVATVAVGSFMSEHLVTIDSSESIHEAAAMMKEHSIRRLPVVDDGALVGILTTTNLTHYLPRLRNAVLRTRGELVGQ
ncbi:CBS domain-containing protein [Natronomonas salina]|uniref:CBS domain-containing protein n=1 Tax=Natronomonas salina TaxID=1710540 RepID=UPI001BA9D3CD|nr:CBS domain-containing protein [Natronomonas salina]